MSAELFDQPYYLEINEARWRAAEEILNRLGGQRLRSCVDVGAGPGWFAGRLTARGLAVTGLEGREELVEIARTRVPEAQFRQIDVERPDEMAGIESADLVFCFGLLYHLENPFAAIRSLRRLTGKVLLLETQIIPSDAPIAQLIEEGRNATQGLTHCSLVPSRAALLKMLERAGFAHLYEWRRPIEHADFIETPARHRRRGIFLAANEPLDVEGLEPLRAGAAPKPDLTKIRSEPH
jgi:SAM-dependent methyltransferase